MKKLIAIISMFFMLAGNALGDEVDNSSINDDFQGYILKHGAEAWAKNVLKKDELQKNGTYGLTVYDYIFIRLQMALLKAINLIEYTSISMQLIYENSNSPETSGYDQRIDKIIIKRGLAIESLKERTALGFIRIIKKLEKKAYWLKEDYEKTFNVSIDSLF